MKVFVFLGKQIADIIQIKHYRQLLKSVIGFYLILRGIGSVADGQTIFGPAHFRLHYRERKANFAGKPQTMMNEEIFQSLDKWMRLHGYGMDAESMDTFHCILALLAVLLVAYLVGLLCRRVFLPIVAKVVAKTKATWDDYLLNPPVLRSIARLVPALATYVLVTFVFYGEPLWRDFLQRASLIWLIVVGVRFFTAFVSSVYELSNQHEELRNRPLKGVYQMLKIVFISIGIIGVVSVLIGKSPLALFTALGAAATVLMLIFKDTITGLVAGVQLSANDMLRPGDWIKMPRLGIDGVVTEVNLTIVKVLNWDNTVTTIPPYTLVSDSFENWRVMQESGGRRVKRSVNIDMQSVRFCTSEELDAWRKEEWFAPLAGESELVNLHVFRAYFTHWLSRHPRVNQDLMLMIRQLQPTGEGLPLELYFFSSDRRWVPYEMLQSEVFEYLLAVLPRFGLRVFQFPSGVDVQMLTGGKKED